SKCVSRTSRIPRRSPATAADRVGDHGSRRGNDRSSRTLTNGNMVGAVSAATITNPMLPSDDPEPFTKLDLNKAVEEPEAVVPAAESLQLRTAEIPGLNRRLCSACNNGFEGEYYHMAGLVACPKCAQERLADRSRKGGWMEVGRAALFGLGAAAAGSALYAIIAAVTGFHFSLVAIVVGVFVGKAVLHGSRGIRGCRFQVVAALVR